MKKIYRTPKKNSKYYIKLKNMTDLSTTIKENLRKIIHNRGLTQGVVGGYAEISESQFSKVINGPVNLSFNQLEQIASGLNMPVIDIITYPDKYVLPTQKNEEELEAILQIRLRKDKKDQVLKLVFGEHNIEILNK